MDVDVLLTEQRERVLEESFSALRGSRETHYESSGEEFTRTRLAALYDVVVTSLRERNLMGVIRYSEDLANERFHAGFDVSEVQTAFNSLEEAMWRCVVARVPPPELADSIGLLSTVLGAGKDALARTYVSLASDRHVHSLDLSALFGGTDAAEQPD